MTNKVRQNSLNNEKWYLSEKLQHDMSGEMIWCKGCIESVNGKCIASQQWIDTECLCAINYNKIKKTIDK